LSGRVVDAARNPVAGAQVALSTEKIGVLVSDGKLTPVHSDIDSRIVQTDSKGVFILEHQLTKSVDLIVAHDKGFASTGSDEFIDSNEIRLQPWGRIDGQVARDPGTGGRKIWMSGLPNPTWFLNKLEYRYETEHDADGRFVFERVPAGWFEAGYLIRTGDNSWSITCRTPIEVKPGRTAHVTLGGSGRPVVGKFVPPEGYDKAIYFGNGLRSLATARPEEPRPDNYDGMTKREQQQWRKEWYKSDEYRRYREAYRRDPNWRHYTFRIDEDGSFRIEDVIAGKYELTVWIEERLTGQGRPEEIAGYRGMIEVPQMPGGRSDEPLDVGELELTMHEPLRIGEMAPLFEARTLDGKDLKLIDYRGKFVLLSFWQPVSHPERQRLQELYDAYNPGGRLSIIGLGSNDTLEEVRTYVEENHIPWPQIFTGEESKSDIAKDYRIPGIPWIFLVAPDGKIIATGLRGEKLTSAVRSALEATNESKPDEQDQPKL
jgi:peroxiredoxin